MSLQRQTSWRRCQSAANSSLSPDFPANREINREYFEFGTLIPTAGEILRVVSATYAAVPCSQEQGKRLAKQGANSREQGIRKAEQGPKQGASQAPVEGPIG